MLIRSKDSSSVNKSSSFTQAKWRQKNSFRQQNKGSITTGAKTYQQFFTEAMRSSQAFIHARICMFENMSKWGNHIFCFRNHLRCFKVKLTPCVKLTRATTTLAGLQFSTPRKDVTNRSRSMWQLISIWQAESAPAIQANFEHSRTFHHLFTQDLSLRHYATPRRPIWQYLVRENGEVRLWEFAGDNEGVIRCVRDEMVSLPWENE